MFENGYIKLHRSIVNWGWWSCPNTAHLFVHCLLKANFEDKIWQGIEIKRGSFVTSLEILSKETGLTVQEVRTALKHLISTNEITNKSTSKNRIITVVKYNEYQDNNNQSNKQVTNEQQTDNKQITTTKEYKEIKNIRNKEYIYNMSTGVDERMPFNYQSVVDLFNSICISLPKIQKLTESRKKQIKNADKQLNGDFENFFKQIEQSDFLTGRSGSWTGCCFDWILKPTNLIKIVEGNYNNRSDENGNVKKSDKEQVTEHKYGIWL